jgi:hypothetical protein
MDATTAAREPPMNQLRASFDAADWLEDHLEQRHGSEASLTIRAMLRAYGRVAELPDNPDDLGTVEECEEGTRRRPSVRGSLSPLPRGTPHEAPRQSSRR